MIGRLFLMHPGCATDPADLIARIVLTPARTVHPFARTVHPLAPDRSTA